MARTRIESPRSLNSISTHIFLWFWFMLLVMLAAVISLPTLDPRNQIPLRELMRSILALATGTRAPVRF